ncbi:hypothetical protein GA0115257_101512 [Streptomyces sp. LcepLS]|nr:hypothetical protein GA0115252_120820 [Streptomyces sp. DfronAA-171]SCE05841.1 hypothetical protein GA0115251_138027 [Streptomyces sp. TverLS-915]SCE36301.1 hypothetical protein GA0115246_115552 [Streptomyces sp. SolWspMP-sol7th]SCE71698.1 hypothetical protein GA0115257_101512 [Streptomyces sp. LcepLS]
MLRSRPAPPGAGRDRGRSLGARGIAPRTLVPRWPALCDCRRPAVAPQSLVSVEKEFL